MKALGTGARSVGWREIEVLPDRRGKPLVYLYGGARERADGAGSSAGMKEYTGDFLAGRRSIELPARRRAIDPQRVLKVARLFGRGVS